MTPRTRALALLLLAAPLPLAGQGASYEQLQTFSSLLNQIRLNYVDSVTYAILVRAAIDGVLSSLDPHSRFVTRAQGEQEMAYEAGLLAGTGIVLDEADGALVVLSVMPKSPGGPLRCRRRRPPGHDQRHVQQRPHAPLGHGEADRPEGPQGPPAAGARFPAGAGYRPSRHQVRHLRAPLRDRGPDAGRHYRVCAAVGIPSQGRRGGGAGPEGPPRQGHEAAAARSPGQSRRLHERAGGDRQSVPPREDPGLSHRRSPPERQRGVPHREGRRVPPASHHPADRWGQRQRLRGAGGHAAGPRSRPARRPSEFRQGAHPECPPHPTPGRCRVAHDRAGGDAERAHHSAGLPRAEGGAVPQLRRTERGGAGHQRGVPDRRQAPGARGRRNHARRRGAQVGGAARVVGRGRGLRLDRGGGRQRGRRAPRDRRGGRLAGGGRRVAVGTGGAAPLRVRERLKVRAEPAARSAAAPPGSWRIARPRCVGGRRRRRGCWCGTIPICAPPWATGIGCRQLLSGKGLSSRGTPGAGLS